MYDESDEGRSSVNIEGRSPRTWYGFDTFGRSLGYGMTAGGVLGAFIGGLLGLVAGTPVGVPYGLCLGGMVGVCAGLVFGCVGGMSLLLSHRWVGGRPGRAAVVSGASSVTLVTVLVTWSHILDGGWWLLLCSAVVGSIGAACGPPVVLGREAFRLWKGGVVPGEDPRD